MIDGNVTRRPSLFALATVMVLSVITPGQLAAQATCDARPDPLINELDRALRNQPIACNWVPHIERTFPNAIGGGGSYNLPVVAAAIAYIREPIRPGTGASAWNMNTWWRDYLRGELGDRGSAWNYGGQELGSGNYHYANEIAVMAVHYQAWKVGNNQLRVLSRRWLQATFALSALAASPQSPKSFHERSENKTWSGYVGPYVAMAGMRSSENHWRNTHRSILFARAAGIASNTFGEGPQGSVRTYLENNWAGPSGNIYGLTVTNQQHLRDVVNMGIIRFSIQAMYAGLHTVQKVHFVGWTGVRLTLLEKNAHLATAPTYGMVYFQQPRTSIGREVHLLYPWKRSVTATHRPYRNGITTGQATLNLNTRTIQASNLGPGESVTFPHPAATVTINNLPAGPASFHVTLSP